MRKEAWVTYGTRSEGWYNEGGEKICRNGQMYQNHLVRSIKWSSDQLHFDSCACSLHAFCMHTCQDWVSQNWIDMMSVHDAQIISVFQSPLDRSACNFSSWSPECVPPVKIVCSGCNPKVQVICGLPDPYPVLLLFCKGGSTFEPLGHIFIRK